MMNIKLQTVISDLIGKTSMMIVKAIIEGEQTARNFLSLVDSRIKASNKMIEKSLQGQLRED